MKQVSPYCHLQLEMIIVLLMLLTLGCMFLNGPLLDTPLTMTTLNCADRLSDYVPGMLIQYANTCCTTSGLLLERKRWGWAYSIPAMSQPGSSACRDHTRLILHLCWQDFLVLESLPGKCSSCIISTAQHCLVSCVHGGQTTLEYKDLTLYLKHEALASCTSFQNSIAT